jgi:hypothetical protein
MPTFVHGKDTAVYIDEFDLTSYFTDTSVSMDNDVAETTAFGDTNKTFITGLRSGTLSLSGLWAADTDGSDEELQALLGNATTPILTLREGAAAIGSRAIIAQANETSYAITSPVADVHTVSAEFECTPNQVSNLTLHVPTNTVNGNTTIKIQHSANNSTWADLISFTVVGSTAKTSEIKAVSGTVNRYLRATASTAGSSGSITFMIAFARF